MVGRRRIAVTVIAAGAAGALALSGCTTGGEGAVAEGGVDTIRGAWMEDPTTWDPALSETTDDYRAMRLVYDTVIRRDMDGELIPGIAESWEQSADSVTLSIADGHACGDGTPITPDVVADSLAYLADPETGSLHTTGIFGAGDVDVSADDGAGTVTIALSEPHSEVLPGLAMPQAGIVCPGGLEDTDALAAGTATDAFSGPYALADASTGVRYTFELHEDYDDWPEYAEPVEGTPARNLEFVVGADEAVANQLLTGEIDVAAVDAEEVSRFEDDDTFGATTAVTGEYYIMFNHKEGRPFADEDVRRAAAQVIDRTALRDVIDPAGDLITTLGDSKTQCAIDDESLLVEQDPDAAAEQLDGMEVDVVGANAIGKNGAGTIYLQERLAAAGADVELTNTDIGSWVDQIYEEPDTWDMTLYATVNNLGTLSWGMSTVLGDWYSDGGRNMTYTDNAEAGAALEEALSADDEDAMCEAYRVAQESALESVNYIPVSMVTKTLISRDGYSVQVPGGREDYTTLRVN